MKYRLPSNCGAVSHAGSAVTIAADASIELDPAAIGLLEPHGIVPLGDPIPINLTTIEKMVTSDLLAALQARNVTPPRDAADKILRGLLRQALAKPTR